MNIIYLGISIIALLTATETYAMEGAGEEYQAHPFTQRSPYPYREEFVDLNVQNLQRVMNNKIYNPTLAQLPSENEILSLCVQALICPNTPDQRENIYFNYAGALLRLGFPTQALVALENGLNVKTADKQPNIQDLDRSELYSHIIKVMDQQGQSDKAIEAYRAFLLLKTTRNRVTWAGLGREKILCQLANVLNEEKRYEEAIKTYQEALKLKNKSGSNVLTEGRPDIMRRFNLVSHRVNLETLEKLIGEGSGNIHFVLQTPTDLSHLINEDPVKILLTSAKKAMKSRKYPHALYFYMQALRQKNIDGTYVLTDNQIAIQYGEIGRILALQENYKSAQIAYKLALNMKDLMGQNALRTTERDKVQDRLKTVEKKLIMLAAQFALTPQKRGHSPDKDTSLKRPCIQRTYLNFLPQEEFP